MKLVWLCLLILTLFSCGSIRIEKKRYSRGFFISTDHRDKTSKNESKSEIQFAQSDHSKTEKTTKKQDVKIFLDKTNSAKLLSETRSGPDEESTCIDSNEKTDPTSNRINPEEQINQSKPKGPKKSMSYKLARNISRWSQVLTLLCLLSVISGGVLFADFLILGGTLLVLSGAMMLTGFILSIIAVRKLSPGDRSYQKAKFIRNFWIIVLAIGGFIGILALIALSNMSLSIGPVW